MNWSFTNKMFRIQCSAGMDYFYRNSEVKLNMLLGCTWRLSLIIILNHNGTCSRLYLYSLIDCRTMSILVVSNT
jgi:hypothetical protein